MGEAKWPKDTASPGVIEGAVPIKWVERSGEESECPVCPPHPGRQAIRQAGRRLSVDKMSLGNNGLV